MPSDRPDRHQREAELFERACELPQDQVPAFLARECAGDAELERRVLALLGRDRDARLGGSTAPATQALREALAGVQRGAEHAGGLERIGPYRILARIGAGGMGVVYEAEQEQPRRSVAIKVLRAGLLTEEHVRRFEHEVEVLGWLEHPGVARIFEAGLAETGHGAQPFFAMELVRGSTLREYAREHRLDARQRLALLARVCDAVHHAHQKGVVHRDLKPGNVLVEASGQPKVLDFGVARVVGTELESTTLETRPGQLLGTLPYMSPEQVAGDPSRIDTRADVYALGVMAYELLVGSLPLDVSRKELAEAARIIQQDEPSSLGSLDRRLRGDVETIVSKAIAKEKERRYASAEELASDIRRFLANEPIVARPPSALYQLAKFTRRNRALVGGVVGIFVALAAGLVVSLSLYRQSEARGEQLAVAVDDANRARDQAQQALVKERAARDEAERSESRAQEALFELRRTEDWFDGFFGAASPAEDGTNVRVVEVLERVAANVGDAFPQRPLARARLLRRIGSTYRDVGLVEKGLPFLEQAAALARGEASATPEDALEIEYQLATSYQRAERYDEAKAIYRALLAGAREQRLAPSVRLFSVHMSLAQCLIVQSRLDEAEDEALAARALAAELGQDADRELADCHELLAAVAMQRGTFAEARTEVEAALAIRERLQSGSWELGNTMHLASQIAFYQRRDAEAEELAWRSLEALRRFVGDEHPALLACYETLGLIYLQTDRDEEALSILRDALAMSERLLEGPSANKAVLRGHIGFLHMRAGAFEEAEAELREAVAELREVGGRPLDLSNALSNLSNTLMRSGRFTQAHPLVLEAIELREGAADPLHYRIGYDYDILARVLEGLGDAQGAAAAQARADAIAAANRAARSSPGSGSTGG